MLVKELGVIFFIMSSLTLVLACVTRGENKARGTMSKEMVGDNSTHGPGTSDSNSNEPMTELGVDEGKNSDSNTDSGARITSHLSEILFCVIGLQGDTSRCSHCSVDMKKSCILA